MISVSYHSSSHRSSLTHPDSLDFQFGIAADNEAAWKSSSAMLRVRDRTNTNLKVKSLEEC